MAVVKLPRNMVRVLREDSEEPEVINIVLAMSSGRVAIEKPDDDFRGGIKTDTGVTFEPDFLRNPDEREVRVLYHCNER